MGLEPFERVVVLDKKLCPTQVLLVTKTGLNTGHVNLASKLSRGYGGGEGKERGDLSFPSPTSFSLAG